MQTKIVKRFHRILPILLCLTACLTAMFSSIKAEASWIDRDASGIYAEGDFGQGIGDIDEDDMAEEEEIDEGTGFFVQMFETIFIWLFRTIGNLLFGYISEIGSLKVYYPFIAPQFPGKLTVTHINRINL